MNVNELLQFFGNLAALASNLVNLTLQLTVSRPWQLAIRPKSKASCCQPIELLSIPDEEFMFILNKTAQLLMKPYLPINQQEKDWCCSLSNEGLLERHEEEFKFSARGKTTLAAINF